MDEIYSGPDYDEEEDFVEPGFPDAPDVRDDVRTGEDAEDEDGGTLYTPPKPEPEEEIGDPLSELLLALQQHILLPASMIAMVGALLFYLVDLRSVFLQYGGALKWLGLCFITATVLIARYGRISANRDRQSVYTGALAAATFLVLMISPWDRGAESLLGRVVNGLILLAAWYYAARVTDELAPERLKSFQRGKLKLYGLERIRYETWQKNQGQKVDSSHVRAENAHVRPNRSVVPLIFGVLLLFALTEPLILMGPPEVGTSALFSVILFLLGAATVLATGSSSSRLEQVRLQGGRGAKSLTGMRAFLAGALTLAVLAVALTMPGVRFQGSGELRPQARGDGNVDINSNQGEASEQQLEGEASGEQDPAAQEGKDLSKEQGGEADASQSEQNQPPAQTPAASALGNLAALGALLKWPLILLAILGGLYLLKGALPLIGGVPGLLQKLRDFLARLRVRLPERPQKPQRSTLDPWIDLPALNGLSPKDRVLGAYRCMLLVCEHVGRPREEDQAPLEFIPRLAGPWQPLRDPANRLTEIYLRAAYGPDEISEDDAREAFAHLDTIRPIWEKLCRERNIEGS